MRKTGLLLAVLFCSSLSAQTTIEGFWQDIAGRTTFKRNAGLSETYGDWYERALDVTYPHAKEITRTQKGFDLRDLNYDDRQYSVQVHHANPSRIVFLRQANSSPCWTEHVCRLSGEELFCAMRTVCEEAGQKVLDWRGEERYIRRAHCERGPRTEAQGIPVNCR